MLNIQTRIRTDLNLPKRIRCRCLTTNSLPWGYPGQLFRLRRMLELDDERRDSRFILVWTLDRDRVIALRPVGLIVLCCLLSLLQGCLRPLFILVEMVVVRLDPEVYSYYLRSVFLYLSRKPYPPLYSPGGKSPSRFTM
jgi:hypothetical protein